MAQPAAGHISVRSPWGVTGSDGRYSDNLGEAKQVPGIY